MRTLSSGALALILALASGSAFAFHCPVDIKKIDAALASGTSLDASKMSAVKELRTAGEELHMAGKHHASVAVLAEAMNILGIK